MEAAGELANVLEHGFEVALDTLEPLLDGALAGVSEPRMRCTSSPIAISRCCVPSWRFRSIFLRASSPAATILARDATSSVRFAAFEMAVATSSVKRASRSSVSGGRGSSLSVAATSAPHKMPSTTIGVPTDERMPRLRTSSPSSLSGLSQLSMRAGAPVRTIFPPTVSGVSGNREPTGTCLSSTLQPAIVTLTPSEV